MSGISHCSPYRVTWLNKGQRVLVNEQAWVEFTIGGYKDIILCDVFPTDVFHLFLGRLWQYDRKAIHNGEKNSYSFRKDGVTYTIESMMNWEEGKSLGPNVLLVGENEFLYTLKEGEGVSFSIVVKPKEEEKAKKTDIPAKVQS